MESDAGPFSHINIPLPIYYRPQTKLGKGNVFTPVCQSFCSQGGVSQHALGQTPPLGRHPLGKHPPGKTSPRQTHTPAQCMLGYTHPSMYPSMHWDRHSPGQIPPCPVNARIQTPSLPSTCWDTPPPRPLLVRILLEFILVNIMNMKPNFESAHGWL